MRGTVNGWTIVHVSGVFPVAPGGSVTFETQDARINGKTFNMVGELLEAEVNWLYAVKFHNSELKAALLLEKL